jgi:hypothetical protein
MIMSIKRWLLGRFNKPAAADMRGPSRIYARITGHASGGDWSWQQLFPAKGGGWQDGERIGVARCTSGTPAMEPPFVTVLKRDGSGGWSFLAATKGD